VHHLTGTCASTFTRMRRKLASLPEEEDCSELEAVGDCPELGCSQLEYWEDDCILETKSWKNSLPVVSFGVASTEIVLSS
jgi:hypothetical protein